MNMNIVCCNEKHKDRYFYEYHRLKYHLGPSSKCLLCNNNYKSIVHHLKNVHSEQYQLCKLNKSTETLYENSSDLSCKFCGYTGWIQHLLKHIENVHIAKRVKCDICEKELQESALYDHKRNFHNENVYEWKCDNCKQIFKHEKTYLRHLETESHKRVLKLSTIDTKDIVKKIKDIKLHDGKKVNNEKKNDETKDISKCDICDIKINKSRLKRHMTTHLPASFQCNICNKLFKRKDSLKRHINTVHNKKYIKCELCKSQISERNYYERHLKLCMTNNALSPYPGSSKWERMVSKFLIENDIDFIFQYKNEKLKVKSVLAFDFYIENMNWIIEPHGKQHYEKTSYKNAEEKLLEVQRNDKLKKDFATNLGINYLEIDTRKYNTEEKIHRLLKDILIKK